MTDKGKERIKIELMVDTRVLGEKDEAAIKSTFVGAVKTAGRENRDMCPLGSQKPFWMWNRKLRL